MAKNKHPPPTAANLKTPNARRDWLRRHGKLIGKGGRIDPWYATHTTGLAIGWRPGTDAATAGTWTLRERRGGRYEKRALEGKADDLTAADGEHVLSWADVLKIAGSEGRPTVTQAARYTLSAAWEAYREARKTPIDPREVATWQRFIEPQLGSRDVSGLSHHELNKWLHDQVGARGKRGQSKDGADAKDLLRKARYTANRRWNLLRAVLNYAFESDTVKSDAAWRKVKPFRNVDRPRTVTATAEQCRTLLTVKMDPKLLGLASGALYTALRLGELVGLRADDIDVTGARVRVRHSKGGAERWVPLSREGRAYFAGRIEGKADSAAVFEPLHADSRINKTYVARGMKAASAAAGIVPRVTMHDLRRSYGSLMLNSGAPIEVIQQVLGHADTRMTRRTYAHLLQATVAKAVQKHLPSFNSEAAPKPRKRRKGA